MELRLERFPSKDEATIGTLYLAGIKFCYTLEDVVRPVGIKVKGKTAIPAGRYEIIITASTRFKRDMPLLLNVPDFKGIRIHSGNTAEDTEGCILVGMDKGESSIVRSREAFNKLFDILETAFSIDEKVWITIENPV